MRRSGGNDSGSTNQPKAALARQAAAETQNGRRGSSPPRRPPIAGPTMKPKPKAMPTMPKALARPSGGVTSVM
jgi:hypothetical protein